MRRSTLVAAPVALIALVVVALLPSPGIDHHRGYRMQASLTDVANLSQAVGLYRDDHGDFPTESQGLEALLSGPPPRINKLPNDPWGKPYVYRRTPSQPGFEIHSAGRNGLDEGGAGDDVTLADKVYRCEDYQVNCGLTAEMAWPLVVAAAFLISVGTLVFNACAFLIRRVRARRSGRASRFNA